jgi:uncharacterized OB-fold protein/acyl dehydratase
LPPDELQKKLETFAGQQVGQPTKARDAVNQPMIRHWCDAVDDRNPIYTDPEFASRSSFGGIVAPPTMLQAWTMRGLRPPEKPAEPGPQMRLFQLLDDAGFTSVVATNCTQEYARYLVPGDELTVTMEIESVSEEKHTALGIGHFITQRMVYRDQNEDEVAVMRFRLLKFKPGTGRGAAPGKAAASRPRPKPGITHDNAFFWDGVQEGKLLIQRCTGCQQLRHPPGPMCPGCQSLDWDTVEASGRGTVYSFVVMHHPPVPPFDHPNPIGLIALEEGTRLVSNLVGVDRDEIEIGMPVELEFLELEEGRKLPVFRPVRG